MLPIYIDIDGTLTDKPSGGGEAIKSQVDIVARLIESGNSIVLWSAGGSDYAKGFAEENGLEVDAAIGKPEYCIDDMKAIKWNGIKRKSPSYLTVLDILDAADRAAKIKPNG